MANENVFIKYLNNHGVDAVQLLSAKELAKKTVLTDEEEVEAIVNAMMSRMSNYVTQSQLNAYTTYSQMTKYIQNNVQAFPGAIDIDLDGENVLLMGYMSYGTSRYTWVNQSTFLNSYFSAIATYNDLYELSYALSSTYATLSALSSYATIDSLSAFAPASELSSYATLSALSSYATLADISAFAPASALSSYITASALTQDYMPVWYGSQAAFDALPSSANPNKLYIILD